MRVPYTWLKEYVDGLSASATDTAESLIRAGLEVEQVERVGEVAGVVVGEVVSIDVLEGQKKYVSFCEVTVGEEPRGIVCGAANFSVGDRVPVALPGAVLPGGFVITARKTYGRVSDGMLCSPRELGLGDDHSGIMVLDPATPLGADVAGLLGLGEEVLDIAVTPDRSYCLSVRGVAREAATAYDLPFLDHGLRDVPVAGGGYPVSIQDTAGCDRYVARIVRGLDPARETPQWMRNRLAQAGMRPVSLAVDVTNYVMLSLGQPLHAFDLGKLAGEVTVRAAVAGERLITLDGVDRELHPEDLVIADESGAIALAGVMGGAGTEVDEATTDILLESAHFTPVRVARAARRHRLPSEACKRFERGVDPSLAPSAAQVAVEMLVSLGGMTADPGVTDVDLRPAPRPIQFPVDAPAMLAGRAYTPDVVRRRLADVGCETSGDDVLTVLAPSWRPDLTGVAELCEEVIRLEGYDTLPSTLPKVPASRGLTREQRLHRQASRALAAAGYVEVLSSPFVSPTVPDVLGVDPGDPRRRAVRLANPLSEQESCLRTTLLPGLLATLVRNVGRGHHDVALFESGLVFLAPTSGQAPVTHPPVDRAPTPAERSALEALLPEQPRHAAVALAGLRQGRPVDWADAVEAVESLARGVGVVLERRSGATAPWHPGRCAVLSVDGTTVGHAGELHPRVCSALGLPPRTCAAEVDVDALVGHAVETVPAPEISGFPPAHVDVALVVDASVPAGEVEHALRRGAGELLESLRLFDVYTGEQVESGKRSLAFALRFRAPDRTLTDHEVLSARDAAIAEAARATSAVLRGA